MTLEGNQRTLTILGCAALCLVVASPAEADYLAFDDSQPTGIVVTVNRFSASPITLNGTISLPTPPVDGDNATATLPKGQDITFQGTDGFPGFFSTPYTFDQTYVFLNTAGGTPAALLQISGVPDGAMQETIFGTFVGSGDPHLPPHVPMGAIVEVGPSQSIVFGSGGGTITVGVTLSPNTPGVPEPRTWMMMLVGFGALGAALRSSRGRVNTAAV
jgi:hypothetical protein